MPEPVKHDNLNEIKLPLATKEMHIARDGQYFTLSVNGITTTLDLSQAEFIAIRLQTELNNLRPPRPFGGPDDDFMMKL